MAGLKALLIDDEEELVSTLVERLGYRGITAAFALDGYEALHKLREDKFDVVVLDLKMPGMDGVEILRRINSTYPDLPVLLITGHGSLANEMEDMPEGAHDYLMKPVDLETLIAKMQEAVAAK